MKANSLTYRILPFFLILVLMATALAVACSSAPSASDSSKQSTPSTPYTPPPSPEPPPMMEAAPPSGFHLPFSSSPPTSSTSLPWSGSSEDTIGFAVGGAKDINNFRENIENGYLPLPTDITCEGLYYDYYFDTGQTRPCSKLYCPSYSYSVTRDPFSRKTDYYLSVGLNSGMKESDFARKRLNLVIVLDKSGSMTDAFNEYYYDGSGNRAELSWNERSKQKIEVAKDAVLSILEQLNDDDRFGIVLYDTNAYLLQGMTQVSRADMDEVYDRISDIRADGSTNLADGMKLGTDLLDKYTNYDPYDYENRIIFITDAMPNTGETSAYSLLGLLKS
ncbi:MAG TPA: VWA domain-containing protein, partial [Dehalococcoidia bacterium]